jgi:alpha-1,3-mannosyltransferase
MPSLRSTQADGRSFVQRYIAPLYHHYALDARYDFPYIILLLLFELAVGSLIIRRVAYTEIDWTAYMQQVELAQTGERDYRLIRGDTGPLVYPAGFLYLFGLLHRWTEGGADVRKAQSFFLGFYLVTQGLVLLIFNERARATRHAATYRRTKQNHAAVHHIWLWRIAMGVLCLSKRLHSIFLLRLFNDGPTMMLLYLSVLLFQRHRWRLGCFIFSLSVSLKMNTLLFAPGLLLLLLQALPNLHSVVSTLLLCCALPQLVLGAPFLLAHPVSYLRKAFELDRSFYYKWTVNWKVQ